MYSTTLIIGGCRSGKSSHALKLGEQSIGGRNLFVATCQPHDAEMAARIAHHQQERSRHWQTIESPLDPGKVVMDQGPGTDILLIDCLTLWISNLMMANETDDGIMQSVSVLVDRSAVKRILENPSETE